MLEVAKILIGMGIVVAVRAQTLEVSTIKPHVKGSACSATRLLPSETFVESCYTLDLIIREELDLLSAQRLGPN